jgi:hypothetical protein
MKRLMIVLCVAAMVGLASAAAHAAIITWNFTNAADYYLDGDSGTPPLNTSYLPVITEGVGAYVPARPWINGDDDAYGSDWASVFAKINTQAPGLKVGDILGGGFTLTGMNHPDAVYGSLYLSPTGGPHSDVLINLLMTQTGSNGNYVYTFGLDSQANVLVSPPDWVYAEPQGSLDFAQVIDWANENSYSGYAAFFGPQIGMSGTSGTTFTVTQIALDTVPEPTTIIIWSLFCGLGIVFARWWKRKAA